MQPFVDRPSEQEENLEAHPVSPFWSKRRRVGLAVAIVVAYAVVVGVHEARAERPSSQERASRACRPQHVAACRRHLERALAAIEWQRKARRDEVRRVLERSHGRQPFAYAAKLAELACVSFTFTGNPRCRPPAEMLAAGRCESGLQVHDPNPDSTADGWMQFLEGTWASTPAGARGWSRFDVLAMAVATEARVLRDGGSWREWYASSSCSGL